MHLLRHAVLATVVSSSCARAEPERAEAEPPRFAEADAIVGARSLELLTLDPLEALTLSRAPTFSDYLVLGRAAIDDRTEREALVAALNEAVAHADTRETKCEFVPHHGLHAATEADDLDIAICFTCGEAWVYRDGERRTHYRIARGRNAAIENLVDAHGLPRAATAQ